MTGLMVRERETLEKYMPGLLHYLDTTPLDRLESRDSDAIDKFREFGGTGLVVPGELGGLGAPAIDAVRAVGNAALGRRDHGRVSCCDRRGVDRGAASNTRSDYGGRVRRLCA